MNTLIRALGRINMAYVRGVILVVVPQSQLVKQLLVRLKRTGMISSFETDPSGVFNVNLHKEVHLFNITRIVFSPGKHRHISKRELHRRFYGYPLMIFSSKSGIVDMKELFSLETRHGGEVICIYGPRPHLRKI